MIGRLAYGWGRAVGRYGRLALSRLSAIHDEPVGEEPCIWACWHEAIMVAIAAHRSVSARRAAAVAPGGWRGRAMSGWLEDMGMQPIPLPHDGEAGRALRAMRKALADNRDVLIAVDGPCGPRGHVRAGALWLSMASGVALRPVGVHVTPALRMPRWDRLQVPLPAARAMIVVGELLPGSTEPRSLASVARLEGVLASLTTRARAALSAGTDKPMREAA